MKRTSVLGGWWRLACLAVAVVAVGSWAEKIWAHYAEFGLFTWIGVDYGVYFAQATALRSGDAQGLYDLQVLERYHQALAAYTTDPEQPLRSGHVLYPPLFAWLFIPFTLPPPPLGFALWTGLNALAAVHLVRRVVELFPGPERPWLALLLLSSFPIVQNLVLGQPMILLACAVAEGYRSLRAGRELRAGLWLAALLFKPQYLVLVGPLLVWKRRWAALAGVTLGALVIAAGSALAAGLTAMRDYPAALVEEGEFHGTRTPSYPWEMINWRSLVLFLEPEISSTSGVAITVLLSAITVLLLVLAWRGPWAPAERPFPAKVSLALVATLLAGYHSHLHGVVLLAAPLAAVLTHGRPSGVMRLTIVAGLVLPTLMLARTYLPLGTLPIAPLFALVLVTCFGCLLSDVWLAERDDGGTEPAEAAPAVPSSALS